MKNFIRTTDAETKKKLFALGYQLVSENDNVAVFLNNKHTATFSENADMKLAYTNNLTF